MEVSDLLTLSLASEPTNHANETKVVKNLYITVKCCAVGQGMGVWGHFKCFEARGTSVTESHSGSQIFTPSHSLALSYCFLDALRLQVQPPPGSLP